MNKRSKTYANKDELLALIKKEKLKTKEIKYKIEHYNTQLRKLDKDITR